MAQVEPMDIDAIESDFDNKENTFHHSNVLSRTPCTEKGYEELDVSELNMKLRYSMTPASSPMSKSFTGPCLDNRSYDPGDENANPPVGTENSNLTRSLNSTLTKFESTSKSSKSLPLQALSADQFVDSNRNASRRLLDPLNSEDNNVTITVSGSHDIDENLSLPSTSSSVTHTPEATTPTKDSPKPDGSPIMRGLKSVLNMFRASQSPIPPNGDKQAQDVLSPVESQNTESEIQAVLASTPVAPYRNKDANSSKRSSPLKESVVFNDDLERELQWKDETTIIFKEEKIPVHKLFFQNPLTPEDLAPKNTIDEHLNCTVEYMDISCNESGIADKTMTDIEPNTHSNINTGNAAVESDNEFLDCETTFTKNESYVSDYKDSEIGNKVEELNNLTIDLKENGQLAETQKEVYSNVLNKLENIIPADLCVESVATENSNSNSKELSVSVAEQVAKTTDIIEATKCLLNNERTNDSNIIDAHKTISEIKLDDIKNESQPFNQLDVNLKENLNITETVEDNKITEDTERSHHIGETFVTSTGVVQVNSVMDEEHTGKSSEMNSILANEQVPIDVSVIKSLDANGNQDVNFQSPYKDVICKIGSFSDMTSQRSNDSNVNNVVPDVLHNITTDKGAECNKTQMSILNDSKSDVEKLNITTEISIQNDKHILEKNLESLLAEINEEANQSASSPIILDNVAMNKTENLNVTSNIENGGLGNGINTTITLKEENDLSLTKTVESEDSHSAPVKDVNADNMDSNHNADVKNDSNGNVMPHESENTNNIDGIAEDANNLTVKVQTDNDTVTQEGDISELSEMPPSISNNSMVQMDNDRDFPELTVCNDMAFSQSPSEIPLPDEDNIEKEILEPNVEIAGITHDVTFPINEDNLMMQIENPDEVHKLTSEPKLCDETCVATDLLAQAMEIPQSDNCNHNEIVKTENMIVESSAVNVAQSSVEITDSFNVQTLESKVIIKNMSTLHDSIIQDAQHIQDIQSTNNENLPVGPINVTAMSEAMNNEQRNVEGEVTLNKVEPNGIPQKEVYDTDMTEVKCIENISGTLNTTVDMDNNPGKGDNGMDNISSIAPENLKLNNTSGEAQIGNVGEDKMNIEEATLSGEVDELNKDLKKEIDEIDEEIITSANNSPYVSVLDLALTTETKTSDPIEETVDPFATKSNIAPSPPLSPKIVSKGTYNFNFDDMEDPFATKTKIRMSPTPDESIREQNQSPAAVLDDNNTAVLDTNKKPAISKKINNRRKSQPERKRPQQKKKFNSTFSEAVNIKENMPEKEDTNQSDKNNTNNISLRISTEPTSNKSDEPKVVVSDIDSIPKTPVDEPVTDLCSVPVVAQKEETEIHEEIKSSEGLTGTSIEKSSSSSEQYFSLGTSGESVEPMHQSKNKFNIPEIDDINFNPFVTKSKMRLSPSPSLENVNNVMNNTTINKTLNSSIIGQQETEINNITTNMEIDTANQTFDKAVIKETSPNISTATSSSKNTDDRNMTVREILTEDEDTIEGPFLEAEDLKDVEKMCEMDDENDMMHFNDLPPQEKDENLENGELFIDADAFEFLLNQNKSNTVLDSGKESLFLKFDPLFAKRVSSDGVLAALQKVQKRQSTPKKMIKPTQKDFTHIEKPVAGPSTDKVNNVPIEDYNQEDQSSTTSKPMMVVNPAVSSMGSARKSTTPPKINRRSLTFTSPAMAVIDRLLSLSGNTSLLNHDTSMPPANREHNETDLVITQLRELLAEKEIHVHNLRSESKELKDRLAALEGQVRTLETESKDRLSKITELNERLTEKTKINKSMATVVEEYERTIASLIAETEQDKKRNAEERMRLIKERDEQTAHLSSMEVSFSDLHSKYEKSKQIILSCKANEDTYKKSIKEFEDNFLKMQNNYELLKQHATSKLNHANQELEKMNRAHEAEVLKLNAMIKRKELHITSLEETLTQKTKANEELTAICDELINKVG